MILLPLGKLRTVDNCSLSAAVDVSDLSAYVTEWRGTNCEWSKIIYNRTLHESWDRREFTTLKLLLATEARASVTFLGGRVGDS